VLAATSSSAVGGLGALLLLPLLWCAWFPLAPCGLSLDCPLWVLFWLCFGSGLLPRPLWVCCYRPLVGLLLPARLCRRLSPPAGGLGPAWGSAPVVPWFRLCRPRLRGVPRVEGPCVTLSLSLTALPLTVLPRRRQAYT